jgi:hypothetical protein
MEMSRRRPPSRSGKENDDMLSLTIRGETTLIQDDKREDAMRQYWEARQGGDDSAALVRVENEEEERRKNEEKALLRRAISALARERIEEDDKFLTREGFALPRPIFAPGTRVTELGDRNFRVERERVEALPLFPVAAASLLERIRREERVDLPAKPGEDLYFQSQGGVTYKGEWHFLMEERAFQALCQHLGIGAGAKYLAELCGPKLRSSNMFNQMDDRGWKPLVLRTRRTADGNHHSVYAVVTPSYAAFDAHDVMNAAMPALADARVELLYDDARLTATALWMPEHVVDLSAGDVFRVGVRLECDDTGRGRIRVTAVVLRNLCLNLIIVAEGEVETMSQVHRGDRERIRAALPKAVDAARAKVSRFLDAWGFARSLKVDVIETFRGWIDAGVVDVEGERDDEAVLNSLVAAWQEEPGDTLADAVNALTRAAHTVPTWSLSVREELERAAGKIVMAVR